MPLTVAVIGLLARALFGLDSGVPHHLSIAQVTVYTTLASILVHSATQTIGTGRLQTARG